MCLNRDCLSIGCCTGQLKVMKNLKVRAILVDVWQADCNCICLFINRNLIDTKDQA
jgi:hypothetical protein